MRRVLPLLVLLSTLLPAGAAEVIDSLDFLPPPPPWEGRSRSLRVPADHEWVTPSERSGLTATPRYDETVDWLRRLCAAAPELEMRSIGRSSEGRDIWMVIASSGRARTGRARCGAAGGCLVFD